MNCKAMPGSRTSLVALFAAVVISNGCGTPSERSVLAQTPGGHDDASTAATIDAREHPDVTVRRVWAGEYRDFYASSISPDGRYMSQVDWSTVDLAVRDLHTGELHRLTSVQRSPDKRYEDAGVSVFSRDGTKLVVGWQVSPDLQLRVLDFTLDGNGIPIQPEPRVLFDNNAFYPYYPFDWSPDDRQILAKVYTGSTNQLALISTIDGSYQALKSFDWREPTMAEFSPDGKYVAYDFLPNDDSDDRDVYVASVDGTYEARIVQGPALDRFLGWHPGGSILFHSDRSGTPGIWRILIADGRPVGPPELVKGDMWRVEPLGFAGDRFYYGVNSNQARLSVRTVDFEAARITGPVQVIVDPSPAIPRGRAWSPDGDLVAYSAELPGSRGSLLGIHRANGEEVRTLRLELQRSLRVRWHPDGQSLVMFARDTRGRRGFHRIDLETGTHSAILLTDLMEEPTPRGNFVLSRDGTTLYYVRGDFTEAAETGRMNLVAFDVESGDTRHIAVVCAGRGALALSPDGSRIAVVAPVDGECMMGTVPVAGGEFTPLDAIAYGTLVQSVLWTPDGRWIGYGAVQPQADGRSYLQIVAVDGSGTRRLEVPDDIGPGGAPSLHPDGRRIAFNWGVEGGRGEVWVMEGLSESATETTTPGPHDGGI